MWRVYSPTSDECTYLVSHDVHRPKNEAMTLNHIVWEVEGIKSPNVLKPFFSDKVFYNFRKLGKFEVQVGSHKAN